MDRQRYFWLVALVYFGVIGVFLWTWQWQLIGWGVGGLLGVSLIWIDRLVYVYVTRPQDQLSIYIQHLVKRKRFRDVVGALKQRGGEQRHLVTQSFLFMAAWVAAAVYVISSSGSLLASGLVLGAGLRCAWEIGCGWQDKGQLKRQLFWQVKREMSDRELKVLVGIWLLVFGLLSIAMI